MRVAVGGFQHETNTFVPLPTPLEEFEKPGAWPELTVGEALYSRFEGMNIPFAGFVEAADGFDLHPLVWAGAEPSGYVADAAFDAISEMMIERLRGEKLDAVYLDLHGAMVTESHVDGEAELLRRVREVVGDIPIAVSLDLHGNMSRAFFERADVVTIYRTYPHIDMAATGARAAALLKRHLDGGLAKAWRQLDYLIPITAQSTRREPGRALYGMLDELAGGDVVSADFVLGFPPADIPDCGASVFAYGTTQVAADEAADRVLASLKAAEDDFANPLVDAPEAVASAIDLARDANKPVVICDPQDNPGAGGLGDSTGLLQALIDADAQGAVLGVLWDAKTADAAHATGLGGEFDAKIGGIYPDISGSPVEVRVKVEALSDGTVPFSGPMFGGAVGELGPTASLRVLSGSQDVRVVVGSARCQNADQEMFRIVGIEPSEQKIVAVKSAVHFLADYEPIAETVIFARAPGSNPCQLDKIPYTQLRSGVRLGPNGPKF